MIKELEVLREKHQNEMTAMEHARKLAKYVLPGTVQRRPSVINTGGGEGISVNTMS